MVSATDGGQAKTSDGLAGGWGLATTRTLFVGEFMLGCPAWKGIAATLLHVLLVACFLGASFGLMVLIVLRGLA